jgi:hypothetical protein
MEEGRWFLYIFMAVALVHATTLMADFILGTRMMERLTILQPIAYFALLALSYLFYVVLRRDLLMLTFSALSVLVIGIIGSGKILYETIGFAGSGIGFFFLMAIITVGLTALCVTQLRALQQRWEVNHE